MNKVILVGGGGHALSLLEMLDDYRVIAGYCDYKPNGRLPVPYLGTDTEVLQTYPPEYFDIHHAVVYADEVNLGLRKYLIEKFRSYTAKSFVASTAIVSPNSIVGEGSSVFHRCVVNRGRIGHNCIINTGSIIEHDCVLGNNVVVASGSTICGGARIGDNVFIGAGSVIRDGVSVTDNTVIGMGSVVVRNIVKPGIYFGNPIREGKGGSSDKPRA